MITNINEFKIINEVGEANIQGYEYTLSYENNWYEATFVSNDNLNYRVDIYVIDEELTIGFYTLESNDRDTNKNDIYKIMSTIINIIKEILNKHSEIEEIIFVSKNNKNNLTNQRQLLYYTYVKKHLGNEWNIYNNNNKTILSKSSENPFQISQFGLTENLEAIDFDKYEIDSYVNIVTDPEKISLYESTARNLQSTDLTFKTVGRNDIIYITVLLKPRNSSKALQMGEMGVVRCKVLDTFYGLNKLKQLKHTDKIY